MIRPSNIFNRIGKDVPKGAGPNPTGAELSALQAAAAESPEVVRLRGNEEFHLGVAAAAARAKRLYLPKDESYEITGPVAVITPGRSASAEGTHSGQDSGDAQDTDSHGPEEYR